MTVFSSSLAALLLSLQGQPAAVETSATETEAKTEQAANDDDKIICRRTAIVGSKFKKKICGTKKQWETLANRGAETTREFQRRGKGLEPNDVPGT
ncbi:hypothetical protein [uncultured Erythrobacter sp.]|uniref:hypothetical protein n=1 Tax=uncultured Erythrobacter sp. TaxID=263913 RepID=UPI002611B160|nr:hypothetical protein [uncultured Erythrobacter sp.]